jgi:hypothetical protein
MLIICGGAIPPIAGLGIIAPGGAAVSTDAEVSTRHAVVRIIQREE